MKRAIWWMLALCVMLVGCGEKAEEEESGETGTGPAVEEAVVPDGEPEVVQNSTRETLGEEWDFTHDGQPERVELASYWSDDPARPDWLEVLVSHKEGVLLWEAEAATQHIGWCNLFACELDGQDYLLRYDPNVSMGTGAYYYRLFSLTPEGEERVLAENSVMFDLIDTASPLGYDVEEITAFLEEVHGYLDQGALLLSTQGGSVLTGIPGADYDLDDFTDVEGDTWREKVEGYLQARRDGLPG